MAPTASTLVDLLRWRAQEHPDLEAYTFLGDGVEAGQPLTYGQLDRQARAIAVWVRDAAEPGDRVVLLYPPGLDVIAAFFGCLYAGLVAVPLPPPRPRGVDARVSAIAADARARLALTTQELSPRIAAQLTDPGLTVLSVTTDRVDGERGDDWKPPDIEAASLAHLQYTSGSTALPKGVMVTHGNVLANVRDMDEGWRHDPGSRIVTWLPVFHDMGLVYGIIEPLYAGVPCVLMPAVSFIQRPVRWLQAISHFKATHSVAPNFAYDLCVRKIRPEERGPLDLRSWRVAVNGAEPVRQETIERFVEAFGPCGFRRDALCPGYGLAEATLKVAASVPTEAPVVAHLDATSLDRGRAVEVPGPERWTRTIVGCGRPSPGTRTVIVRPETLTPCEPGEIGEIWVAGPGVARGYWGRPSDSASTFRANLCDGDGPYLRTGDLGFLKDGELFVTGRLKDLIIIRGQNHYPQDIEWTVEKSHPEFRPASTAAFSIDRNDEERLIVVQEVGRHFPRSGATLATEAVREAIAREHELHAHEIVLIKPGSIPKTSSGKIQRRACRAAYLDGTLAALSEEVR